MFALIGLAGGLGMHGHAAWAADCVRARGGDIVINASDACVSQLRRDPAWRSHVVRTIDPQAPAGSQTVATNAAARANRDARGGQPQGLAHPLARMSLLNEQGRYLWSLGNPAPAYYGQVTTR